MTELKSASAGRAEPTQGQSDLARRLRVLDGYDDTTFGAFTSGDILISALLFVLVPVLIVWCLK
jgi:hypothetical protein